MTKGSKDLCATITPSDNAPLNVVGGPASAKNFLALAALEPETFCRRMSNSALVKFAAARHGNDKSGAIERGSGFWGCHRIVTAVSADESPH